MDTDISRWVTEFLLRSSVPDSLIRKALIVLPLSGADSRFKKTLLLRTLRTLLLKASLSETALQILEHLEELDGVSTSVALRRAYLAVAVECTVKYLAAAPDDPEGEFSGAVKRIWRGRVAALEARRSGLVSGELVRWRDDVEAALGDSRACERLADFNSRREAMKEVRAYLKEASESMGPSFLESVAAMSKGLTKEKDDFVISGDGCDSDHDNGNDGDHGCMEDVVMHDENQTKQQLEEKIEANQEVGGRDLLLQGDKVIQKRNLRVKHKHSALRACHRGVKINGSEEVESAKSLSKHDSVPSSEVKKVRESLKSSSYDLRALVKDPLPDALHLSEAVRSKLANSDTNIEPPIEKQSPDVDVPDPNVCQSIVLFQSNDANLGKESSVHSSDLHQPNLMERNRSAQTFEWDDSIDNSPQARQTRRRKRRWSSLEEETLRAGVKMFGEGNWATIKSFYSNIFDNRSGVDLKDKWRNMLR
ncbi:uncharacterized protein LOC106752502 isoform X1 [Vigna radiata var. radiata]|uniref:Uncharacterized protein LOC106752502 isoform X1 n=1 Tax=Vigna radiata var. radiata TaxID=3916 RepID=A0A1S3T7D6_VIGRR|nr:uncharacterized protein LOC106752502 isoform X1 [Vigna radiata var. radiata]XP_014489682.1 uncharacterized protein LOC106752502 isoform X1 [Vigna radiata var. radiata]XP_022632853.1 uncharacterized protein LOC106752502 isoform X1 [Vigna radiata var. radiata]XP_022632854.1 uncharacterized protein LOC106752502 isoform X1 [Vigna radiata var. radiata]